VDLLTSINRLVSRKYKPASQPPFAKPQPAEKIRLSRI